MSLFCMPNCKSMLLLLSVDQVLFTSRVGRPTTSFVKEIPKVNW